jgi:hypothetical protein
LFVAVASACIYHCKSTIKEATPSGTKRRSASACHFQSFVTSGKTHQELWLASTIDFRTIVHCPLSTRAFGQHSHIVCSSEWCV